MASGLPVVVSSEGGPAEQIRHGEDGLVVDLDRPRALADAIALCLLSPSLRARLGSAARRAAQERDWDMFLAALFPGSTAGSQPADRDAAHVTAM